MLTNVKKQQKRYLLFLLLLLLLVFLPTLFLPWLVQHRIQMLLKLDITDKQEIFYINHRLVYRYDENKNQYSNLVSYRGTGTGYLNIHSSKKYTYELSVGIYCVKHNYNGKNGIKLGRCKRNSYLFTTKSSVQPFVVSASGTYKIELWGAGGGNTYANGIMFDKGGRGAYVSGELKLKKGDILYLYVGSRGKDGTIIEDIHRLNPFSYPSIGGEGGYNGGGDGFDDPQTDAGGGGGGATDVRLISGDWDDFASLKSRVIVAGGGGGSSRYFALENGPFERGTAGNGGTINGENALNLLDHNKINGYGATQTSGYRFGIGENGKYCQTSLNGDGGGAGGYFGSRTGACGVTTFEMPTGAGGGSSYVSGCKGCRAIIKNSTEDNLQFSKSSIHYSGIKFENIVMKAGSEKMPNPLGGEMTGNRNNGYARITRLK